MTILKGIMVNLHFTVYWYQYHQILLCYLSKGVLYSMLIDLYRITIERICLHEIIFISLYFAL